MAAMFVGGAFLAVVSPGLGLLVVGRSILGLAVGGASVVVPVYLSELAPYEIRGKIAGRNELMIVVGQVSAFVVNAVIGTVWGETHGIWRVMLAVAALPGLALLIGMIRLPESPRWLVSKGNAKKALAVFTSIRSIDRAEAELAEVQRITEAEKGRPRATFRSFNDR